MSPPLSLLSLALCVTFAGYAIGVEASTVAPDATTAASMLETAGLDQTELRWNTWTEWSECTATCAGGQQLRLKVCSSEEDANCTMMLETDDAEKVGYRVQWDDCNPQPCPIHGGWGAFSNWSDCSASCDQGYETRERACDSPSPAHGGDECDGKATEHRFCQLTQCPEEEPTPSLLPDVGFTEADKRPSAISIGTMGIAMVAGTLGLLVLLDLATLGHHCARAKRNIQHAGRRRGSGGKRGGKVTDVASLTPRRLSALPLKHGEHAN